MQVVQPDLTFIDRIMEFIAASLIVFRRGGCCPITCLCRILITQSITDLRMFGARFIHSAHTYVGESEALCVPVYDSTSCFQRF